MVLFLQSFLGDGCDSHNHRRYKSTTLRSLSLSIHLIRYVEMFSIIFMSINIMTKICQIVGICNDKIGMYRRSVNSLHALVQTS